MHYKHIHMSFTLVALLYIVAEEIQNREERQSREVVAKIKSCQVDFIYKKSYALIQYCCHQSVDVKSW